MPVATIKNWLFGPEEKSKGAKSASQRVNLKQVKPFGDHLGDGALQLSFTLPIPVSLEAKEAARLYTEKLGFEKVLVAGMEAIGPNFSFFVVYASALPTLDFTKIKVPKAAFKKLEREEIEEIIQKKIGRKVVVVGATTGSDAHTVGIDAILNKKGFAGDYGLESYQGFKVVNLRAQVDNAELIQKAIEYKADVILISKLVTQQDQHLKDLKSLHKLMKQNKSLPPHLVTIVGGPRISHAIATRLGFDAGFGSGTLPVEVASFIVLEMMKRLKKS